MELPNGQFAMVDVGKLSEYCLNLKHIRGRHKARVFLSVLAMTSSHAEELGSALLLAARNSDASINASDEYGTRYIIDFVVQHEEKSATVRSAWIIRTGEDFPRFVTCYVLLTRGKMSEIEPLAVVAILKDIPEHGLVRGQVGTVVELLTPLVVEVEFSDDEGRMYALVPLRLEELIRLHHRPLDQVA